MAAATIRVEGTGGVGLVVDVVRPDVVDRTPTEDPGSALVFLLVHGLASNARLWDGVARFLGEEGFASAAVDLRGHGRSDKPDDGYDYDTMCADLEAVTAAVADATGAARTVAVGQSYGGNLVLELAARQPASLVGVACVDGGVIDLGGRFATFEEVERELAPPVLVGMPATELEEQIRAAHPDWSDEAIAGTMANLEVHPDGTVSPWLTLPRHLAILRAMWSARPTESYPRIAVPVLLLPAESPGAPSEWAREKREGVDLALASLADAQVQWFSPADHDVHAQHPRAVGEALVRRFAQVDH
jgi:pimeloyl-ACP methyl ester carboxylesterase